MSIPMVFLGRSLTCPTEAFTTKPEPRYFLMVLALAGDSTTSSPLSPDRLARRAALAGAAPSSGAAGGLAAFFSFGLAVVFAGVLDAALAFAFTGASIAASALAAFVVASALAAFVVASALAAFVVASALEAFL